MLKHFYIFVLLIIALTLCFIPMPYGYKQLVHLAAIFIFGWMAYKKFRDKRNGMALSYIFLFILYLPFELIYLADKLWNIVYIATILFLLWNIYKELKQKEVLNENIEESPEKKKKGPSLRIKWYLLFIIGIFTTIVIAVILLSQPEKVEISVNDSLGTRTQTFSARYSMINQTISGINADWTISSGEDSLAVFAKDGKRGYFNCYTQKVVIEPKYSRAWIFSEGLAGVELNGYIGFINNKGEAVIDFKYPYQGNSCKDFVFHDGLCVVADTCGKCGVIDKTGRWIIKPEYDYIRSTSEYAIVSMKNGKQMQIDYSGNIINKQVEDDVKALCFTVYTTNNETNEVTTSEMPTGYYIYTVCGRVGLMNENGKRLTEPLYSDITAINKKLFQATLLDKVSNILIDEKGKVIY